MHDKDTKRVAGKKLIVRNSTLAQLRALDVGAWHSEKYKGTITPTIAEVFETVPGNKKVFVEVKCGPEIVPVLIEEVKKSGLTQEQLVLICFKASVIKAMKEQAPEYKAYWLTSFKRNKQGVLEPTLESVLKTLKETQADGLDCNGDGVPDNIAEAVKNEGYELHVYTVNDPNAAKRMSALGVSSITSDVPGLIKQSLGRD